jgi:hypothetical protein
MSFFCCDFFLYFSPGVDVGLKFFNHCKNEMIDLKKRPED